MNTTPRTINTGESKQKKLVEKLISDLEDLCKTLTDLSKAKSDLTLRDDCFELQKFCSKLEFLIQLNLKEKKSILSPSLSSSSSNANGDNGSNTSFKLVNTEYWSFILDSLKSSRGGFQDAVKYVKSLNEIKTNLGRARGFIRFCLQYHRLADAVQQLTMEEKFLNNWYGDKAVWLNEAYKSRIIQLLYDLNEISFDLVSKNNFELDTSWPTMQLSEHRNNNLNNPQSQVLARNRTASITSYTSIMTDRDQTNDNNVQLLSSTPLEMDDDLMFSNITQKDNDEDVIHNEKSNENLMQQSIYYDVNNTNIQQQQLQLEINEKKMEELTQQLASKDFKINELMEDLRQRKLEFEQQMANLNNSSMMTSSSHVSDNFKEIEITNMSNEIENLKKQLDAKSSQNTELNVCLVKQTTFCENLSELLRKSEQKNVDLSEKEVTNSIQITRLEKSLDELNRELASVKFEKENLLKDSLSQTESVNILRENYFQQEKLVIELKADLANIKDKRSKEIDADTYELQRIKIAMQLKEEENYLLNDQIQKLSKSLDDERKQNDYLSKELNESKQSFKATNEKNNSLISQLTLDNDEIKKRLVKLIKEKADLWQKADTLEYENMLKSNAMWIDDKNCENCMSCSSQFSIMLRKHHCRVCLKIYCYYCCNQWINYNNSTLRVCKKCFEQKETTSRITSKPSNEIAQAMSDQPTTSSAIASVVPRTETESNVFAKNEDNVSEEESDPDIAFEVRPEKLNSFNNSHEEIEHFLDDSQDEEQDHDQESISIYDMETKNSKSKSSKHDAAAKDDLFEKVFKQEKDGDLKILEDDVQKNTSLQARKTKATIGISIKSGANNLTKKLASSEKSYLLASFFKTQDHDRSGEHEQAYSTDDSDLVVNRIKVRKKRIKEALTEYSPSTSNSNNDFAILSKDELDKF